MRYVTLHPNMPGSAFVAACGGDIIPAFG